MNKRVLWKKKNKIKSRENAGKCKNTLEIFTSEGDISLWQLTLVWKHSLLASGQKSHFSARQSRAWNVEKAAVTRCDKQCWWPQRKRVPRSTLLERGHPESQSELLGSDQFLSSPQFAPIFMQAAYLLLSGQRGRVEKHARACPNVGYSA